MATVVTTSKRFSLQLNDWTKALIMAVLTPVVTIIYQSVQAGSLTFDWKAIGIAAISGGLGYIMKNFLSPAETVIKNPTPEDVTKVKQVLGK